MDNGGRKNTITPACTLAHDLQIGQISVLHMEKTQIPMQGVEDTVQDCWVIVTGPLVALVFNVKPEATLKQSLELLFCSIRCLGHLLHRFSNSCHSGLKHPM